MKAPGWLAVVFRWFVFGNAYIALCAVVMTWSTARLFTVALPAAMLPFVFTATLASYSLHWYLTPLAPPDFGKVAERSGWNDQYRRILLGLLVGSSGLSVWYLLGLSEYWLDLLPVVILTFLYTAPKLEQFRVLRRVAVLKTAYLAAVWTYTTAALPLLVATPPARLSLTVWVAWLLNRFLLIYAICLWFDYRDRADDGQARWLTIVSMLTEPQINRFFGGIVLFFTTTAVALYVAGVRAWAVFCLSVPMLLLVLTARRITNQSSEYGYYVYLDGLMMLSGLLLFLLT